MSIIAEAASAWKVRPTRARCLNQSMQAKRILMCRKRAKQCIFGKNVQEDQPPPPSQHD